MYEVVEMGIIVVWDDGVSCQQCFRGGEGDWRGNMGILVGVMGFIC